jgi:hypothetical protein
LAATAAAPVIRSRRSQDGVVATAAAPVNRSRRSQDGGESASVPVDIVENHRGRGKNQTKTAIPDKAVAAAAVKGTADVEAPENQRQELDLSKRISGQGMPRQTQQPRTPRNKRFFGIRAISTPQVDGQHYIQYNYLKLVILQGSYFSPFSFILFRF